MNHLRAQPFVILLCLTLLAVGRVHGADKSLIELTVLDGQGNEISTLTPGMEGTLRLSVDVAEIPERMNAAITVKARITTYILGQKTRYSFNLPLRTNLGSTRNPDPDSTGEIIGAAYNNQSDVSDYVFSLPDDLPEGSLQLTVSLKATGATTVSEKFNYKVSKP